MEQKTKKNSRDQEEISLLTKENEELQLQTSDLLTKIDWATEEMNSLRKDKEKKEATLKDYANLIEILEMNELKDTTTIATLQARIKKMEFLVVKMSDIIEEKITEIRFLQIDCIRYQEEISLLAKENEELKRITSDLLFKIDWATEEMNSLRKDKEEREATLKYYASSESEMRVNKMNSKNKKLKTSTIRKFISRLGLKDKKEENLKVQDQNMSPVQRMTAFVASKLRSVGELKIKSNAAEEVASYRNVDPMEMWK